MPCDDTRRVPWSTCHDAIFLRFAWDNHRYLFRTQERRNILSAAAPEYFAWTQQLLLDDVLMRISRLTDPPGNRHQENLTLEGLLRTTAWKTSAPEKWERFAQRLDDVRKQCSASRAHRHKRLSHNDLTIASKQSPLPEITFVQIDEAVGQIERFIQDIFSELRPNSSQSFQIIDGERYVAQLIRYLSNRPARAMENVVSRIRVYGEGEAELLCGYCGGSDVSYFPGADGLDADRLRYWHFGECSYVVGNEEVVLDVSGEGYSGAPRLVVSLART